MIERLAIIGVGLIGGSLARALKQADACDEVVGYDLNQQQLHKACELGVIDRAANSLADAVSGASVIVVATSVGAMESVFTELAPLLEKNSIVTDVGSTKGSVVAAAGRALGEKIAQFIPAHPIAGNEKNGVEASFAELFIDRKVILTPLPENSKEDIQQVSSMWQSAGAQVESMGVSHHDEVLAATSHLPHLLAYSLVDTLSKMDESMDVFKFAAGGFRDFTRIASSDPKLWHDICLANSDAMLTMIGRFSHDLEKLSDALRNHDGEYLMEVFASAKSERDAHCQINPD